jgi:hypothetical protein
MARYEEINVVYVHACAVVGVWTWQCDMLCIVSRSNVSAVSENSGKQMRASQGACYCEFTAFTAVRVCVSVKTVPNVGEDRQSRVIGRSFAGHT